MPAFASLQLKKFELEFSVDPLFKKASADFDEGGAKGLLLNHLAIDSSGRIVFDSSDDAEDATADADTVRRESGVILSREGAKPATTGAGGLEIDIDILRSRFFADLTRLDDQDICPSLKNFDVGDSAGSTNVPFLKAPEDWKQAKVNAESGGLGEKSGIFLDEDNAAGFDDDNDDNDDDDGVPAGFDAGGDADFGEGGEAWANDAAVEARTRLHNQRHDIAGEFSDKAGDGMGVGGFNLDGDQYVVSLQSDKAEAGHQDILSFFDNVLQKNWAGPEHWRIRRMKDIAKIAGSAPSKRKEKEPFEISFLSPLDASLAELIYTPATSNAAVSLPKSQWKSKTRNLLPDDKHFNSRQLLRLFLKPGARMGSRRSDFGNAHSGRLTEQEEIPEGDMNEAFWAPKETATIINNTEGSQIVAFGTQMVTQSRRLRPEYMQYARVAKKVDVRKLKEEMWRGIGFEQVFSFLSFPFLFFPILSCPTLPSKLMLTLPRLLLWYKNRSNRSLCTTRFCALQRS